MSTITITLSNTLLCAARKLSRALIFSSLLVVAVSFQAFASIKIASIFALDGMVYKYNKPSVEGVRDGVKTVNEQGGVNGELFELKEFENSTSTYGSKRAALKAIEEGATAIVGGVWASHAIAIAKVAQKHKTPMISSVPHKSAFSNPSNPDFTKVGDYIFRLGFSDSLQGRVMAKFAFNDLKAETASILVNIDSSYSVGLADEFQEQFKKMGGKVVLIPPYKYTLENLEYILRVVKEADSKLVFLPGRNESVLILEKLIQSGVKGVFLGADSWSQKIFKERATPNIKLAYHTSYGLNIPKISSKIKDDYKQSRGNALKSYLLAYDSVLLLADAIKRAGSLNKNKIREALSDSNFKGLSGRIYFSKKRNLIKEALIIKVAKGKTEVYKSIVF